MYGVCLILLLFSILMLELETHTFLVCFYQFYLMKLIEKIRVLQRKQNHDATMLGYSGMKNSKSRHDLSKDYGVTPLFSQNPKSRVLGPI